MGQKVEDPFMARLNRLDTQAARQPRSLNANDYPRDAQNSVLLPIAAMVLLIVGGASFGVMMAMPDPNGASLAATTLELLSNR